MKCLINGDTLYISYYYLETLGISYSTITNWSSRNQAEIKIIENKAFVSFSDIPPFTRSKLPSENTLIKEIKKDENVSCIHDKLLKD